MLKEFPEGGFDRFEWKNHNDYVVKGLPLKQIVKSMCTYDDESLF